MAKTTKTTKDVKAAANNDSKLITQGKLNRFATKFWDRIKTRYDGTFKEVTLTNDKKLKFTKVAGGNTVDINLDDYARLSDKNDFKQDVSADNVAITNNSHIGSGISFASQNRSLGFRQLTTNSFVDGYIDHIRVYMESNVAINAASTWKVWAIKKGATDKNGDIVNEVIHNQATFNVNSITGDSAGDKFVKIPINKIFENDIYFIVQCTTHNLKVVSNIEQRYTNDVVNMNQSQPPMQQGEAINWANGVNATENTAIMYLYGRESIGSLSLKLKQIQADSSLYVKHTETTNTGGTIDKANMVVKLDSNGKLDKNMLPSIAINDYFEIDQFTDDALRDKVYENGDVAIVTGTGKKYLCIKKRNGANSTEDFIELNSKDGSVVSVNGKNGEVNLELEATTNELKLKIKSGSETTNIAETSVAIITDGDIDAIINGLQD